MLASPLLLWARARVSDGMSAMTAATTTSSRSECVILICRVCDRGRPEQGASTTVRVLGATGTELSGGAVGRRIGGGWGCIRVIIVSGKRFEAR